MHGRGVVHRDVKAANILLTRDGHVKLADFGVACSGDQQHNTVIGTPAWMSPELIAATDGALKSLGHVTANLTDLSRVVASVVRASPSPKLH